jgi:hypothetical protein
MPRAEIQTCALIIGALLLHELKHSLEKKEQVKEDGLRNGFVKDICMVHQTPC